MCSTEGASQRADTHRTLYRPTYGLMPDITRAATAGVDKALTSDRRWRHQSHVDRHSGRAVLSAAPPLGHQVVT